MNLKMVKPKFSSSEQARGLASRVMTKQLNCREKILDLSRPAVMGILNLSKYSFSPVGRVACIEEAVAHAKRMESEGADIIDVGAEPTNPVNPDCCVSEEEEYELLLPAIAALVSTVKVPISIDTSRPNIMKACVEAGASMINDTRALRVPGALETAAKLSVPICLMHMRFLRLPGQVNFVGNTADNALSVIEEIKHFFSERINACEAAGIAREHLVLDPGIGGGCFGKSTEENLELLRSLPELNDFHLPLLVGVSRKLFIGELLNIPVEERLVGSLVATFAAIQGGANIIRAHDVLPTVQAIHMMQRVFV